MLILKTYTLQRSSTLCFKNFIQQPMKSMVAPNEINASIVEFDGNG